jgi:uncharacterized iron-regulated membrane protein
MNPGRKQLLLRKAHRWLGVVTGLQLLAWTVSGLYFTLIPIGQIRGEHLLQDAGALRLGHTHLLPPSSIVATNPELRQVAVDQVQIRMRGQRVAYLVVDADRWTAYDAESGVRLPSLVAEEAASIVRQRTHLAVKSTERVTVMPAGSEFRGMEMPAFRVSLSGEDGAQVYVGAESGQVRAVRTDQWRLFDFLWGLHIMDYESRKDFNHWLIQLLAGLSLLTVLSGIVLFITTVRFSSSRASS